MQEVTKRLFEMLKNNVDKNGVIDISVGKEKEYLVSRERFRTAFMELLKDERYVRYCTRMNDNGKPVVKMFIKVA